MTQDDDANAGDPNDIWARLRSLEEVPREPQPGQAQPAQVPPAQQPQAQRPQAQPPQAPRVDHTEVMASPVDPSKVAPSAGAPGAPGTQAPRYYVPAGNDVAAQQRPAGPAVQRPPASQQQQARGAYAQHAAPQPAPAGPGGPPGGGAPGTPGASPSEPARAKKGRRGKRWYRPKLRWFALYLPLLVMALIAGLGLWGWKTVKDLGRVDVGDAITAPTGDAINYLIVGSDAREDAAAEGVSGYVGDSSQVGGQRSDTIIVLRVEPERSLMMSIPRDLWVTNVSTGQKGRINGTYNQGPDNLIRSVTANLGIPINHYVEVDFVSFAAMVDAMGGVDIEFPHAVFDKGSGLNIISPGTHKLDGAQALAYVRSRHYTEIIDGNEVQEPTADLGRQQRQQSFIRTVLKTAGAERNPLTLAKIAGGAAKGVKVDQKVGFGDLLDLARKLGAGDPETRVLPTSNANKGGAAVLELKNAEALPILAEFGAG